MDKKITIQLNSKYTIRQLQSLLNLCETERQAEVLTSLIDYIDSNNINIPLKGIKPLIAGNK